jgi:hypothetical protein
VDVDLDRQNGGLLAGRTRAFERHVHAPTSASAASGHPRRGRGYRLKLEAAAFQERAALSPRMTSMSGG